MKKLTIEFVRESFAKEGYTLLSEVYITNTKLEYICKQGHTHKIMWDNWRSKQRCPTCARQTKPTIEYVRQSFANEGYTLISKVYINNNTKLDFVCPQGHNHSISLAHWKENYRCIYCSDRIKHTFEEVKKNFESEGYTLLSTEYVNSKTKLNFICDLGHNHSIIWDSWASGARCYTCGIINRSGSKHHSWIKDRTSMEYCEVWQDKEYKYSIRERDGHVCLNPYCTSKDPTKLSIHHINYDKKDCHFKNLITVCRSCNSKANIDRDWHQDWYQALLHNRYGYNY